MIEGKLELLQKEIAGAGAFLRTRFRGASLGKSLKSERDFVISEDLESEQMIREGIERLFPEDSIVGEEGGHTQKSSEYTWIIDPLCGTNNFAYRIPLYGISVARMRGSEFLFGMVHIPETGDMLIAEKGAGAFLNGKPIDPMPRSTFGSALVLYDNQWNSSDRMTADLSALWSKAFSVRITGSAAYDISLLARGAAHVRIFHKTKLVDFAPAAVILGEIGGSVTDFNGESVTEHSTAVVLSRGVDHAEFLAFLRE